VSEGDIGELIEGWIWGDVGLCRNIVIDVGKTFRQNVSLPTPFPPVYKFQGGLDHELVIIDILIGLADIHGTSDQNGRCCYSHPWSCGCHRRTRSVGCFSSHEQCIVLASQPLADCQSLISHLYQLSLFPNPSLFLTNYLQTTSERSTNPQPPEALNHPRSPSTSHNRR
jgi:hypothetical protein